MTQNVLYNNALKAIESKESELNLIDLTPIEKTYQMILFLKQMLIKLKQETLQSGFKSQLEEITFFKVKNHTY